MVWSLQSRVGVLIQALLLASAIVLPSPVAAKNSRSQPLRSCLLEQPALVPILKSTTPATDAEDNEDDDEDEEEDDEDDEDEDFDDEAVRGILLPDGVTCLGFGGSSTAGVQGDWLASTGRKAVSWRNQDLLSIPFGMTFKIDTLQPLDSGLALGTGLTLALRSGSDTTIDRAVVTLGGFAAGLDSSRFNFWDGANFASVARVPARQSHQFAYDIGLTETARLGLSAEVPVPVPSALPIALPLATNAPGLRLPDLVARYLYEGDGSTFQIAGALHEVRQTFSGPPRIARAVMIGMTQDFEIGGIAHSLSGQVAGTLGAPVYIGSQLDGLLTQTLVASGTLPSGYSVVGSLSSRWTDTWSTNAFWSRYDLHVPARAGASRIEITRMVANIVWSPSKTTRIGVEAGVTRTTAALPGLLAALDPTGRRTTLQLVIERKF